MNNILYKTVGFWLIATLSTSALHAHPWHRHAPTGETHEHDASGGFVVPADGGAAPANSEAVANIAESVSAFNDEGVFYRWDDTYFYIESSGVPEHDMYVGITSWQQQVTLPQNYYGENAFRIPLEPQISDTPISFLTQVPVSASSAVGVAVNGIPIFPALNNRNEDTLVVGELDDYGGHAGRGDDYHYHTAPLHLVDEVGIENPIGFGLDGFALYGLTESDGSAVTGLDEFNGQYDDGIYHYHATETFPYHMGGLRGEVEIDQSGKIVQPRGEPVRQSLTPLRGAEITDFDRIGENSYSLTYTQNSQDSMVQWSWDADSQDITFDFVSPDGSVQTDVYPDRYRPGEEPAKVSLVSADVAEGIATITAEGEPGYGFQLQTSTDGEDWELFGYALIDATGSSTFELEVVGDIGYLRAFDGLAFLVTTANGAICNSETGGDIDGNGTVEFADFLILSGAFGQQVASHAEGDIDCNGTVGFADFLVLSGNFGQLVGTQVATVPEPQSFSMLFVVGLVGLAQRRRTSVHTSRS